MTEPQRVAMIGLGRMGGRMADHILGAGHSVRAFDIDPAALAARVDRGAIAAGSPADAATDVEFVHLVVFDDAQARAVLANDDGVLTTIAPGSIICVHTTVSLATIRELAQLGAARGVEVLDAGISGGEAGAQAGTLLSMVGGSAEAFHRVEPVLAAFSKEVLHAGPLGTGMALKLARNATSFGFMAVVYEALLLAHGSGVDLAQLKHALSNTGLFEQALVPLGFGPPGPLADDAPASFRATLEHAVHMAEKDLDQATTLAAELGISVDLFRISRGMFHDVMRV